MKNLMALAYLILAISTSAYSIDLKKVEESKLTGKFYNLHDITLVTQLFTDSSDEYGDLTSENINRVREVPVSFLEPLGLKEKDKIQYAQYKDGKAKEYILKKKIFVLVFKSESDIAFKKWGTFNLILSDDPKEHQRLGKLSPMNPPQGTGLAYSGNDIKFRDGQTARVEFSKLPLEDDDRSTFVAGKSNDLRVTKVDSLPLLVDFTPNEATSDASQTTILKIENNNYLLKPVILAYEAKDFVLYVGNFIKDYKLITATDFPDNGCSYLYLITSNSITHTKIHCIPENLARRQ